MDTRVHLNGINGILVSLPLLAFTDKTRGASAMCQRHDQVDAVLMHLQITAQIYFYQIRA